MRALLADQLIAKVMSWGVDDVSRERPILQAMADYKYDSYQQFSPGMRFIESLALWLGQFPTDAERQVAYAFVKERLLFCSQAEMNHLVGMTYKDVIKPILTRSCADEMNVPAYQIAEIVASKQFEILRRRCLFLGLSDGGRIDVFRRSNPELSPEQIFLSHELTLHRVQAMVEALKHDLRKLVGEADAPKYSYFKIIFLLDDFSGSGLTNLRRTEDETAYTGKIAKFVQNSIGASLNGNRTVNDSTIAPLANAVRRDDIHLVIVLYTATQKALGHLIEQLRLFSVAESFKFDCEGVQIVRPTDCVNEARDEDFLSLVDLYYDKSVENKHTQVGKTTDVKRGFAGCSLPLVLFHNTPNNSVFLLWSWSENVLGLFPRVTRHGGEA